MTSKSQSIVAELRQWMIRPFGGIQATAEIMGAAADEIERLSEFIGDMEQLCNGEGDLGTVVARRCARILRPATALPSETGLKP